MTLDRVLARQLLDGDPPQFGEFLKRGASRRTGRAWIATCLETGWNSVLFDASALDVAENTRQTIEVVAEAERHGAQVEGEIESARADLRLRRGAR